MPDIDTESGVPWRTASSARVASELLIGSKRSAARAKPAASRRLEINPNTKRLVVFIGRIYVSSRRRIYRGDRLPEFRYVKRRLKSPTASKTHTCRRSEISRF